MQHLLCLVLCLSLFSVSACTTRAAYETIRQGARNECYQKPSDPERDSCLNRTQDTYDEYKRKRDVATGEGAQ